MTSSQLLVTHLLAMYGYGYTRATHMTMVFVNGTILFLQFVTCEMEDRKSWAKKKRWKAILYSVDRLVNTTFALTIQYYMIIVRASFRKWLTSRFLLDGIGSSYKLSQKYHIFSLIS